MVSTEEGGMEWWGLIVVLSLITVHHPLSLHHCVGLSLCLCCMSSLVLPSHIVVVLLLHIIGYRIMSCGVVVFQ